MKSKVIFVALCLLAVLAMGAYENMRPWPYYLSTPMVPWEDAGNLTATQATLAVGARDFSAVWDDLTDAATIKYEVPNWANGVEIRYSTTADADSHVVEIWTAVKRTLGDGAEDSFTLGAIHTLTGGTQVSEAGFYVDTLATTAATGILTDFTDIDSGNNRIAIWRVDLRGYKYLVFIATTFEAATTLQADVRWY
jgi:hypothetical protein